MYKVSVIIPIYNVEEYLEKALDSVCCQTMSEIEIICIDDCSTDRSRVIVEEYAQKDKRIKLICLNRNHNQGYARNIGIENASGEYLMFLDGDDWLASNACEVAYKNIKDCDVDILTFNYYIYYEKYNTYKLKDLENKAKFSDGIVCKRIFKTDFIKSNDIKFGDMHCSEDNIFFIKSMLLANNISFIKTPLYYYRKRKKQNSTTDSYNYCFEAMSAKEECYEIAKSYPENFLYDSAMIYAINTTLYVYKTFSKKIKNIKVKEAFYYKTKQHINKIINDIKTNDNIKPQLKYHQLENIGKYNFYQYNIINFLEKIFSIYNEQNKLKIVFLFIKITF